MSKQKEMPEKWAYYIAPQVGFQKRQPVIHIWGSHREELGISERTLYNYIDGGVLSLTNLDLRRKVGYRPRKKKKTVKALPNKEYLEGRRYEDYLFYLRMRPQPQPIEMDTVKGFREQGKRIPAERQIS